MKSCVPLVRKLPLLGFMMASLLGLVGCGGATVQDHIPDVDDARGALEAALTAWKSGALGNTPIEPPGQAGMVVSLFDRDFSSGRKLQEWKVESAEPETDGPRQFKVTLTIDGEPQPAVVTYYVTGIQKKYSVFRDVDYAQRATEM